MPCHIHMPIGLETDALLFKQGSLATPARGGAAFFIDYTMTGQKLSTWRIAKRSAYHTRMARPTRQSSDMTVCSHSSARNLADDVQHGIAKGPCLFWRHSIRIVVREFFHKSRCLDEYRTRQFFGKYSHKYPKKQIFSCRTSEKFAYFNSFS